MRKTIFVFATTALALWWVFEPIVASVRYSKSNEAKLDAAAKRLNAAFVARGMRVVGEQIYDVAETLCAWDEKRLGHCRGVHGTTCLGGDHRRTIPSKSERRGWQH